MKFLYDLHTHTTYSHGKGGVLDNALAAKARGLGCAIADHGAGHRFYGVRPDKMAAMRKDIEQANAQLGQKRVLQSVEANLTGFGSTDINACGGSPDFALLGLHKGASMGYVLPRLAFKSSPGIISSITDSLILAIEDERIILITHPGLYIPVDMARLARACAEKGVLLELSARHPMPPEQAVTALECGAYFAVSSDAHTPEKVGRFEAAEQTIKAAGIPLSRIANSPECDYAIPLRCAFLKEWGLSFC